MIGDNPKVKATRRIKRQKIPALEKSRIISGSWPVKIAYVKNPQIPIVNLLFSRLCEFQVVYLLSHNET